MPEIDPKFATPSPLGVPDVAEQTYTAQELAPNRPVRLAPMLIPPGERTSVSLPYSGRTATQYLATILSREARWCTDGNRHHTQKVITFFHGVWADTGNNAGYFRAAHLRFAEDQSP